MPSMKDEERVLGASWSTLKSTTEVCLVTTESRLAVHGSDADTWVLNSTSTRFAIPGTILDEDSVVAVKGKGGSQKLVKFGKAGKVGEDEATVELGKDSSAVHEIIGVTSIQSIVIVYADGCCELRSSLDLKLQSNRLEPTKGKKLKVVCARYFPARSCLVLLLSNASFCLVRIINHEGRFRLESDSGILSETVQSDLIVNATIHSIASSEHFVVSLLLKEEILDTYQVSFAQLHSQALVSDVKLPSSSSTVMDAAPGSRLVRFNSHRSTAEAWDIVHGVMLESWPVPEQMRDTCTLLRVSPSGRSVAVGDKSQVQIFTVNIQDEPSTLARAVAVIARQPTREVAPVVEDEINSGKSSKKRKKSTSQILSIESVLKKARIQVSEVEYKLQEAWRQGEYDELLRLAEERVLVSTRSLGDDEVLVQALKAGRTDLCEELLNNCSDVPPKQIALLIRFCLEVAGNQSDTELKDAVSALTKLGKNCSHISSTMSKLDAGVAVIISQALTCKNVIESEMLQVLSDEITCAEEVAAILSCLVYTAENADSREAFNNIISACSFPLDARPLVKLPVLAKGPFERLKRVVQRELIMCEKTEQSYQTMHALLEGKLNMKPQHQFSSSEYRTEIVYL